MNDLIDRNSLLKSLEKFAPEKHDALVEMLIKKEPTVDAVPVIRCKDCIKKELCSIFRDARQELGFCAWAERKEE